MKYSAFLQSVHNLALVAFTTAWLLCPEFLIASPSRISFQARIVKPDGKALEASSVHFRFSVLDPLGTCVIYQEDHAGVSMTNSSGGVTLVIGSGTRAFPLTAVTMNEIFDNGVHSFSCQSGGSYVSSSSDKRRLAVQFNDGSGWQTLSGIDINSVPFSLQAESALKLGSYDASEYLRPASLPSCAGGEALHFNGSSFTCVSVGSGGGGSVASVSSANAYLTIASATTTPNLTINVGTTSGTLASGNDSRIINSIQTTTGFGGDVSGTYNSLNLNPTGVSSGIYSKVSVDAKGRVTSATNINSSDVISALGYTPASSASSTFGTVTSVNGIGVIAVTSGTTTPNISILKSTSTQDGYLASNDWTTFNNKQNALGYTPLNPSNNLSEVSNTATARSNLGLGNSSVLNVGTTTGTVAAGDDSRIVSALQTSTIFSGDVSGAYNSIILNDVVTSGTYNSVTVDTKGRVTSATVWTSSDLIATLGYTPTSSGQLSQFLPLNGGVVSGAFYFSNVFAPSTDATLIGNSFGSAVTAVSNTSWGNYNDSGSWVGVGADGFTRFVYFENNHVDLKLRVCSNSSCSSATTTTVASYASQMDFANLLLGSDGFPRITVVVYASPNELHYIRCLNATCSSKNDTTVAVSSSSSNWLYENSFTLGADGFARMSFDDYHWNGSLYDILLQKTIQCLDADCSTRSAQTIDAANAGNSSIGLTSAGLPYVIFQSGIWTSARTIRVVQCTSVDCSTNTSNVVATDAAYYLAMGMGQDDMPRFAYQTHSNELKYVQCTNAACTTKNSTTLLTSGATGNVTLVMDSSGFARILGGSGGEFYFQCLNDSCTSRNRQMLSNKGYPSSMGLNSTGAPSIISSSGSWALADFMTTQFATSSGVASTSGLNIGSASNTIANGFFENINTSQIIAPGISITSGTVSTDSLIVESKIRSYGTVSLNNENAINYNDVANTFTKEFNVGTAKGSYTEFFEAYNEWYGAMNVRIDLIQMNYSHMAESYTVLMNYDDLSQAAGYIYRVLPTRSTGMRGTAATGWGSGEYALEAVRTSTSTWKFRLRQVSDSDQNYTLRWRALITTVGHSGITLNSMGTDTSSTYAPPILRHTPLMVSANKVGILTARPAVALDVASATDAIALPVGTSAQRPANLKSGMVRFNSSLSLVELYNSGVWSKLSNLSMTRTLPNVINDTVEIGVFNVPNGGNGVNVQVVVPDSSFSVSKYFTLPIQYSQTGGSWVKAFPISDSGGYSGNNFDLDINVNGANAYLRLRRTAGATSGTAYVTISQYGTASSDTFTPTSATASAAAPTQYYSGATLTQVSTKVGISTDNPQYTLDVSGDISAAGCVRAGGTTLGGTCSSDERLKTEVKEFNLGLEVLLGLKPKTFKYNGLGGSPVSDDPELGFIAQEVERAAPDLIVKKLVQLEKTDLELTEIKQVKYSSFLYIIINSVKELFNRWQSDSQNLHSEMLDLSSELKSLKETVAEQNKIIKRQQKAIESLESNKK